MTEPAIMILAPTTTTAPTVASATVTADCGHECWVAPSGQSAVDDPEVRTECLRCIDPITLLRALAIGKAGYKAGARKEVLAELGEEAVQQMDRLGLKEYPQ